jgi:hypothetical protein
VSVRTSDRALGLTEGSEFWVRDAAREDARGFERMLDFKEVEGMVGDNGKGVGMEGVGF